MKVLLKKVSQIFVLTFFALLFGRAVPIYAAETLEFKNDTTVLESGEFRNVDIYQD